jgi:hypothetical protein
MKSTFLLSFLLWAVCTSYAQNPPCNITKLDWQTAFTSDEGSVSYFMESSDCKGKELCGQPKIGLKHSFKKPIWIKVKLKGFNCDNQAIVGEFYTNRTYITSNEVYVAKHNWHTFKSITEVVNVEVAYEETTVQSVIYNKDGNTVDTYVDGKYQKKAPTVDVVKAAAKDSVKKAPQLTLTKAPQLATAEQAKKNKSKTQAPSVKNAKSDKKQATNAVIAQKSEQKLENIAPVPAAATPSVQNAQKRKKTTTTTANGQRVAAKPVEKPVIKNSTPSVKTDSKTSVAAPTTTATQEALKKATEPTVSEGNTPSGKMEKATPEPIAVQPVAQPNISKAADVVVAKQAAPIVTSKNFVPPTEVNQAPKQAANQATAQTGVKRPTDKTAERPQAYMPATKTKKTVDAVTAAPTPAIIEPDYTPLNVLKTNILYPISLGYEHALGKHVSFFVNGFFMPALSVKSTTNTIRSVNLLNPSLGFAGEARYYISKTKAPLNGIYWGGFFTTRTADISINSVSASSTGTTDITIKVPLGLQMYGLMLGKQRIGAKGFTTDFGIGVGSYTLFGVPNISPNAEGIFGRIGELTKNKTGVAPRVNVNLGYAF